jgi:hypothetical protein
MFPKNAVRFPITYGFFIRIIQHFCGKIHPDEKRAPTLPGPNAGMKE